MWPCCGIEVFALAGWHTRLARVQLDPFVLGNGAVMVFCLHAAILSSGHQQQGGQEDNGRKKKRRRSGQKEEKTKDKKRTTGGQGLETGWQPRPSWCQQEDNRGTSGGQEEDKKTSRGRQEEGNGRTRS